MRHWICEKFFLATAFKVRIVLTSSGISISRRNFVKPRLNIRSRVVSLQQRQRQDLGRTRLMFSINELKKLKLTFWNLEMLIFSLISLPTRELRRLMKSRYIFDLSLFGFSPVTRAVAVVSCMVVTLNKRLVSH